MPLRMAAARRTNSPALAQSRIAPIAATAAKLASSMLRAAALIVVAVASSATANTPTTAMATTACNSADAIGLQRLNGGGQRGIEVRLNGQDDPADARCRHGKSGAAGREWIARRRR